jgi:hypothetical protein
VGTKGGNLAVKEMNGATRSLREFYRNAAPDQRLATAKLTGVRCNGNHPNDARAESNPNRAAVTLNLEGLKGPEMVRRLGMRPKDLESLRARPEYKAQLVEVGNELTRRMDEA